MSSKSPSTILYDFLKEIRDAAETGTILQQSEILDSKWQKIEADQGIVVSNSEWDFSPVGEEERFYDALLIIGFYKRIVTDDDTERRDDRDDCFTLAKMVVEAIRADQSLGGRVCDYLLLRAVDGMDNTTSQPYALIHQPIILNPTGNRDFNLGEAR